MAEPTVSVVVPTYNRAETLPRAIESVLNGSYEAVELHVVDDGSTDETPSIVTEYDDDRMVFHRLDENRGANAARNYGIESATGNYVAFLDSDNSYTERYLELSVTALEAAPEPVVGSYGSQRWYRDGNYWNLTVADVDVSRDDVRRKNVVGGFSNVVFRRRALDRVGPLDERFEACQDYDLFLRALATEDHRLVGVRDAVVRYYQHETGAARIGDDQMVVVAGRKRLLEKHGEKLTAAGIANQYYQIGMAHARADDIATARRWFRRGLRTDPTSWRHWYHFLASLGGRRLLRAAVGLKIAAKRRAYEARYGVAAL